MGCSKCEQERLELRASLGENETIFKLWLVKNSPTSKIAFCSSSSARSFASANNFSRSGNKEIKAQAVDGQWLAMSPLPSGIVMAEGQDCLVFD